MTETVRENPLGYVEPKKLLRQFAVPSIVAMLVTNLYNLVDQVFIGWRVGMLGNAATNVAFPLTTICFSISLLIGIGSASRFGLELGRKNPEIAKKTVGNAILISIVAGLILAVVAELFMVPMLHGFGTTEDVLPYAMTYVKYTAFGFPFLIVGTVLSNLIRADGSPKYSMICMLVGAIINTILDPVLMFGLGMGMEGAALATVIAQVISFIVSIAYFRNMKQVKLTRDAFRPDFPLMARNLSYGLSNCLTQLGILVVQISFNHSLIFYGAQSVYGSNIPLTAFGVMMKINGIVFGFFIGISQGSQPIYSFNYGAAKYDRVKAVYKQAAKLCLLLGLIATIAYEVFPRQLMGMFGTGTELYFQFAVWMMRTFLCMTIFAGIQLISSNFFAAIAMPWKGVILSMCRQVIFMLPILYILPKFLGLKGLGYCGPIVDLLSFLICILLIRREFKRMDKQAKEQAALA